MDTLIALSLLALVLTPLCLVVHGLINAKRSRTLTITNPALVPQTEEAGPTFVKRARTVAPAKHFLAPRPWSIPPPALGTTECLGAREVDLLLWNEEDDFQLDFWPELNAFTDSSRVTHKPCAEDALHGGGTTQLNG